jgi:hypothetical protein
VQPIMTPRPASMNSVERTLAAWMIKKNKEDLK